MKAPRMKMSAPKMPVAHKFKMRGKMPSGPHGVKEPHGPQVRPHADIPMGRGKGSTEEHLPSRHAMSTLTGGDQVQRSLNQYAKGTPGPDDASPSIMGFGSGI